MLPLIVQGVDKNRRNFKDNFKVFIYFGSSMMHFNDAKSIFLLVEKIFEMTTSLSQYEAFTIFHAFVDVFQCSFLNCLNTLPYFVS